MWTLLVSVAKLIQQGKNDWPMAHQEKETLKIEQAKQLTFKTVAHFH